MNPALLFSFLYVALFSIHWQSSAEPVGHCSNSSCLYTSDSKGLNNQASHHVLIGAPNLTDLPLSSDTLPLAAATPTSDISTDQPDCSKLVRSEVKSPTITVSRTKLLTHRVLRSRKTIRVEGAIEGRCIKEAGIYQNGRQKFRIPVKQSPELQHFTFNTKVTALDAPEIRAYTMFGDESRKLIHIQD